MSETISTLTSAIPYKPDAPLRPEIEKTEEELDISISYLRYEGIRQRRVSAVLVEPMGDGPFPALALLHPFAANKMFFFAEAKALAAEDFVALLVEAPHKRAAPHGAELDIRDPKSLRSYYLQTMGDIRRGYDLLEQLDTVDSGQLGYVGQSEAAALAPAISAVEPRIGTVVSIAGIPRESAYWQNSAAPAAVQRREELGRLELRRLTDALAGFDAVSLLAHARAHDWLFQFGNADEHIPDQEVEELRSHLPEAASILVYEDDHEMESLRARTDRRQWLTDKLHAR